MTETVRVGKRFTVVIPRAIRRKLGLREGMLSKVEVRQGRIILTPDREDPFEKLAEVMGPIEYTPELERETEKWMFRNLPKLVGEDEWNERRKRK